MNTGGEMNFTVYYEVSGDRIVKDDEKKTSRRFPAKVRLATLMLGEAQGFATDVYKREGIVLEIHELPIPHQRRSHDDATA